MTVQTAKRLHVKVEQDGVERVRLALPPTAAERLSQLVPPPIAEEVRRRGVDIDELERKISAGDLPPRLRGAARERLPAAPPPGQGGQPTFHAVID